MRWFNNKSIKRIIQWFLLVFSSWYGFFWLYISILYKIVPTVNTWSIVGSLCLAISSTYGLFYWLVND